MAVMVKSTGTKLQQKRDRKHLLVMNCTNRDNKTCKNEATVILASGFLVD